MVALRAFVVFLGLSLLVAGCEPAAVEANVTPTGTLLRYASSTPTRRNTQPSASAAPEIPLGPSPTPFVHIVQQGETLLGIALRYGVALEDLVLVNPGVDPGFLTIGLELRIPGEEGEPVDTLLPTPTPVPVELGPVECFESLGGSLICLLEARNGGSGYIQGLTLAIRLHAASGEPIEAMVANAPLEFVDPGQAVPVAARFSRAPEGFSYASAMLQAAVRVGEPNEGITNVTATVSSVEISADGQVAVVEGMLELADFAGSGGLALRILGIGRNEEGRIVGYRLQDTQIAEAGSDPQRFAIDIYSLGPLIARVDVLTQVRIAP